MIQGPVQSDSSIRLVIYDLDGTLVDAFEDIALTANDTLAGMQLPKLPIPVIRRFVGNGSRMLIARCLAVVDQGNDIDLHSLDAGALDRAAIDCEAQRMNRQILSMACEDFMMRYRSVPVRTAKLYPEVKDVISTLREKEVRQVVLTNKLEDVARVIVAELGIARLLDGVWGDDGIVPKKPDPLAADRILQRFRVPGREIVVVGDSAPDIKLAQEIGAKPVGVSWGASNHDSLRKLGAQNVINSMVELYDLFPEIKSVKIAD